MLLRSILAVLLVAILAITTQNYFYTGTLRNDTQMAADIPGLKEAFPKIQSSLLASELSLQNTMNMLALSGVILVLVLGGLFFLKCSRCENKV